MLQMLLIIILRRSPHGGRGLKLLLARGMFGVLLSLPAWGAWIEISFDIRDYQPYEVAPRMGGVD